ncbi:MAG: division/cell wall cluster transcriptional repressor MraZ [Alphaproteobacteria bacterium]|nr:division/cell wall cluster transcriptional repressor MraZ [Alphaproteobacteria bacterium]
MGLFLSTTINRIDRKGRVSVPGPFRAVLGEQPFAGVILMKSPIHAALEGFAPLMMEDIASRLDAYPMFSMDQDDLAAATLAEAMPLHFDTEGRIVLSAELVAHAGFDEEVAFVGLGRKFQMWSPAAWKKRREVAQKSVKTKGLVLPARNGGEA